MNKLFILLIYFFTICEVLLSQSTNNQISIDRTTENLAKYDYQGDFKEALLKVDSFYRLNTSDSSYLTILNSYFYNSLEKEISQNEKIRDSSLSNFHHYLLGKKSMWSYDAKTLDKSIIHLKTALSFFVSHKDQYPFISTDLEYSLGIAYSSYPIDSFPIAREYFDKVIREGYNDLILMMANYYNGYVCELLSLPESGLKHNLKCEELNKNIQIWPKGGLALAGLWNNISIGYRQIYELDLAEYYSDLALSVFEKKNSFNRLLLALRNKAQLLEYKKEFEEAIKVNEQVLSHITYKSHADDYISNSNNMANQYWYLKNYSKSLEIHKSLIPLKKETYGKKSIDVALSNSIIGQIYSDLNEFDKAQIWLLKSLSILRDRDFREARQANDLLRNLALLAFEKKEYNSALDYLNQSINVINQVNQNNKSSEYRQGLVNSYILKVKVLFKQYKTSEDISQQELLDEIDRFTKFVNDFLSQSQSSKTKKLFLSQIKSVYDLALSLAFENNSTDLTLSFMEQSKSLLMKKELRLRKSNEENSLKDIIQNRNLLESEIGKLEQALLNEETGNVDDIQEELIDLNSKRRKLIRELSTYDGTNLATVTLSSLQSELDTDELLLQYHLTSDTILYRLLITQNYSQIDTLPFKHIYKKTEKLIQNIKRIPDGETEPSHLINIGYDLFSGLVHNKNEKLDEYNSLIIIPDGILNYVPYRALITNNESSKSLSEVEYLIKEKSIRQEYSAYFILNNSTESIDYTNEYVGFAPFVDQSLTDEKANVLIEKGVQNVRAYYGQLPFTKKEVESFSSSFEGLTFTNEKATVKNFEKYASGARILHLSTHAFSDENDSYLKSGVAFYGHKDSINLDYLNTYEIQNSTLNSELAILSACETGTGEYEVGEGVSSIARAFKYAGCPNTIMSLWQVSDFTTSDIISRLQGYLKNGYGKSEALRQSQLAFLESCKGFKSDLAHPYYWSGLVLIGDDVPVVIKRNNLIPLGFLSCFIMLFGYFIMQKRLQY